MLRGNTYVLGVKFFDCSGKEVNGKRVEKAEFVIGEIDVLYDVDGENERVVYDEENNRFLIALTESDTLGFAGRSVKWQAKALLETGEVVGSIEKEEYLYDTLCKTVLNADGEITYESEITILQALFENVVGGGIADYDNLIDKPKINGVELQGNKTSSELGIATKTSELENDGDGESAFATETYVDTYGGKIDSISVNGAAQTIDENKNVDITMPTATSDLQNDSGYITNAVDDLVNYTKTSELGSLASKDTVNYATEVTNKPFIPSSTSDLTNDGDGTSNFATESYVNTYGGKIDKIQKNGVELPISNKTVNISVPVSASDVGALADSTKYGASVDLSVNTTTYVLTAQLKDQDGNAIGSAATVDLPLESIIVSATYYATYTYDGTTYSKVIVITLSTTNVPTIIPVGDLVSGLVPDSRTIAGVDLQDNITVNEMKTALGLQDYVTAERAAYNCNTCYDAKIYMVANGSNCPSQDPYGTLFVMPYRKASGNAKPDYATQIFMPNGDDDVQPNSLFYRTSLADTWNDWVEVAKLSDVPTNLLNGEGTNSLKMKNSNTVSGSNSLAEGTNNVVFADNAHAEGYSVTKATNRGITTSSTDAEIQEEWLASDPEGNKFSLAKGENSHIEGSNCLALGSNSHAEGNGTRAVNNSAHTEGTGTVASGKYSHAEGLETVASGARAHSEGDSTVASGDYSHAQGRSSTASHAYSFVSGRHADSSADYQTVLGKYSASDPDATLIVCTGSKNTGRNSFATGHDGSANFLKLGSVKLTEGELSTIKSGGNLPQGIVSYQTSNVYTTGNGNALTTFGIDTNGDILLTKNITAVETSRTIAGVDLQDNITASELRTAMSLPSAINGTANNSIIMNDVVGNVASGECCFAEGKQNTASGALGAHAEGYYNIASGSHSHAEGEHNTSSGQDSHTEGWYNTASGYGTHAEGGRNTATFEYAHAEGQYTESNGFAAHTEGCRTTTGALARQSHAEGYYTEAHNYQSHAEGDHSIAGFNDNTVATFDLSATYDEGTVVKNNGLYYLVIKKTTGNNALDNTTYFNQIQSNHAEGQNTRSTSVASHAEGVNSIASGKASHAEGNGTYATNNAAHSEGTGSQATGKYSHAEGLESVASGSRSHAEGYTTTASGDSAHAQGRDTLASGKYSFAGGRGTTASKENQTALGQYNATDNEALLIVGTGSKSGDTVTPRNSFAAGHDGTASFIKVGSTKFRETELAKISDIPTSVNGLGGGTLTSPLNISGGDSASASKIAISNSQAGQITDQGNSTIFGFLSNNDTTLTVGGNSYALNLRGSGTRPTYKGNALALYSDLQTDTNTWRPVKVNGVEKLTNSTSGNSLDLVAGTNVSLSESNGAVTISATDTTYSSQTATQGGTTVSLVTTGEKYTWNNKQDSLVSGTNIKTINNQSILGSGNITISGGSIQTIETYTISSWTALSSSSPYTYQATVTATATIGNDTIVELYNDQPVAFATYGFAIGSISGQNITIYSIGQPSSSVTLKVGIGG